MQLAEVVPAAGLDAGLLQQLALGALQRVHVLGAPALGDLPGVVVERVAELADQVGLTVAADRHDTDGVVLELDHAVDARLVIGTDHLVLAHTDPGIAIDLARGLRLPGVVVGIHERQYKRERRKEESLFG